MLHHRSSRLWICVCVLFVNGARFLASRWFVGTLSSSLSCSPGVCRRLQWNCGMGQFGPAAVCSWCSLQLWASLLFPSGLCGNVTWEPHAERSRSGASSLPRSGLHSSPPSLLPCIRCLLTPILCRSAGSARFVCHLCE